jgi:hypothetical protein
MPSDEEVRQFLEEGTSGFTSYEWLLILTEGLTPEQARAQTAEKARINANAANLVDKPVEDWPEFQIQWDLSSSSFYWALDGARPSGLDKRDLTIRWCALRDLDAVLTDQSRRGPDELWSVGDALKLARVLVHCSEGRALTPPWILPMDGAIGLVGGNHRLAVCRAKRVPKVPVLLERQHLNLIAAILPLHT